MVVAGRGGSGGRIFRIRRLKSGFLRSALVVLLSVDSTTEALICGSGYRNLLHGSPGVLRLRWSGIFDIVRGPSAVSCFGGGSGIGGVVFIYGCMGIALVDMINIFIGKDCTFVRLLHLFGESAVGAGRHSLFLDRGIAGFSIIGKDRESSGGQFNSG